MSNEYFNNSGAPGANSQGSSAVIRGEFTAVSNGFAKLPILSGNGGKLIKINTGGTAQEASTISADQVVTLSGAQTLTDKTVTTKSTRETKTAVAASDIDLSTGNYFTKTIGGNTTFTVSNVPAAGTAVSFLLDLTNGGAHTVTWFSGVKWSLGAAPTLTASGRDVLGFFTHDGGATWNGFFAGKGMA